MIRFDAFTMGPLFNPAPDLSAAELLGVDIDIGTTLLDGQHESVQRLSRQRPGEVVRRYDAFTQTPVKEPACKPGGGPAGKSQTTTPPLAPGSADTWMWAMVVFSRPVTLRT